MVSEPVFWMMVFEGPFDREHPSANNPRIKASSTQAFDFMKKESDCRIDVLMEWILVVSEDRVNQVANVVA